MTYSESLEFLAGLQRFGLRPGLETTLELARRAGVGIGGSRFLHVAGTNGKGSTCAFLEAMHRAAGRRVGLYTSPHLVSFRERLQLDRQPIPEADVARWVDRLRQAAEGMDPARHPSFFEWVTVLALGWFAEQRCDLVVWETGMGGRWDATNVVVPEASVITNVGWDHMQWLGQTLPAIAAEKAGIIKPGRPVLTASDEPEVLEVLRSRARELGAPFRQVADGDDEVRFVRGSRLALVGEHQVRNAALAVATARTLDAGFPVGRDAQVAGLTGAVWPGRFQRIERDGRAWILDGAHNRPAFEVLAATLAREFPDRRFGFVLGMLGDKDAGAAVDCLGSLAGRVRIVPVPSTRAGDPRELEGLFRSREGLDVATEESLATAMAGAGSDLPWVVAGSLYLVGEALELLAAEPAGPGEGLPLAPSERRLNDWSPKP